MTTLRRTVTLTSPEQTTALAGRLAARLAPGDTILMEGGIGAGKTHFARGLILSLLDVAEDVPSPTFTLVQTYDTRAGEVWHADLYRLTGPDEAVELGLAEAFETAICLVEWPDRLGDDAPGTALRMGFEVAGDTARRVVMQGPADHWRAKLDGAGLDGTD